MPSGGNVEYMEDIISDEGSPERAEVQKQSDRAQALDGSRSSTANARNRDGSGKGADQNIPADRNSASRKSAQAPNNAPGNSARENLQSADAAHNNRPKRARVAALQSDEQTHEQSVDRPKRPPIQAPPTKDFELPNDKLLGDPKDEHTTSAKRRKRTSAPSPAPTFVHPNDKLLASKKDEPTTSSRNRTRRPEPSPPRIIFEHPNDKLLKNARKHSHDEANRSSDSENDVSQKPRISGKKSGDDQRKTISAKKLGIAQRKVLSTQELRERRMQPLLPVIPVYPLRTGHVGFDIAQPADIRIPPGGHRLLSNRPMASMKDFHVPGNLQPGDYDDDIDDDDDYLSGLDEYDDAQHSKLIPCIVDRRTGQLVPISQPMRRLQPPPQPRSTTATTGTEFRIRFDENRQVRPHDDARFDEGFLQQRASRQMIAPGITFGGSTGLDSYAYAREPLGFDEQNPNYLHYQPDALLQERVASVQPNIHHQTGSVAAPRRLAGPPNKGTDFAEASSVDPRHARLVVSDYASQASIPAGQISRGIRQPGSGLLVRRQLTTTAQSGSAQTPKTPDEIDQVLDALANGDRHQRAQHYFDSPSLQAAGHSSGTQQRTVIRRMVPGDPQHAGSSTSGSRKASMDGSGSSGRDAEYQRAVKEEIIDDGELDELSRSPADASDDIDPQQLHAAMEDVALDTDRTYRLQLEARIAQLESRVEELITERDQYRGYASSATKRLQQCKCGKRAERPQDAGQPSGLGTGQSSYGSAEQHSLNPQPSSHSQRNGSDNRQHIAMSAAEPSNANGQYSQSSSTTTIRRVDQRSSTATNQNGTSQQRSSNTRGQASRAHQSRSIACAKPYH